ncbi:DUF1403 family protein [Tropicimonas sp. IMCC34043]|uniref:DUF1403 family protein n=1 Tax=Tropicimonas sp. IMCC34043 TaxID=2248760 RepID=UPI000E253B0E|nr:DUF1403 family protein [Tropicimonas sp. IMCC34043]
MIQNRSIPLDDTALDARAPGWIAPGSAADGLEALAFRSGAALAALHPWVATARSDLPQALLRDRLALAAAEACVRHAGRSERIAELRDEIHLLRPGETPGPAGTIFALWRRAVGLPLRGDWTARMAEILPDHLTGAMDGLTATADGPVAAAAAMLETVLADHPREEAAALILADAVLARALGWPQIVPLLGTGLPRRALRAGGEGLRTECHRAVAAAALAACRTAADLARRAAGLARVEPKLRAKGSAAAVLLFLTEDAVSPSVALSPIIRGSALRMTDRAARRLCDRLVELGVVRELTGRPSFRLYGL